MTEVYIKRHTEWRKLECNFRYEMSEDGWVRHSLTKAGKAISYDKDRSEAFVTLWDGKKSVRHIVKDLYKETYPEKVNLNASSHNRIS
ncbi:hypothetical protein SEA_GOCRAZY_86 [Arthrobacter phage GoCrazy]|uniref:Uncharacterized protein n=1 Tax=Arthrobacter phage KeaneyLin TaxID=2250412 RepID=A0A345KMH4_9CAUD|nr:hypothetical protein PQB83_gp88 [Arthrobacter phage KeaneyLin]AXH44226.1 hypothetical protein SEA_KEANEYLIN_88 [Arthrobacter phage KeaneyLin]QXO13584.1 hypothetical protein SEA_GOCRAZY_86 [Arthrobacter phage GoCrazy]